MITIAIALFITICMFAICAEFFRDRNIDLTLYLISALGLILFCALRPIGSDQDSIAYRVYFNMDDYALSLAAEPSFILLSNFARTVAPSNGLFVLFFIYAVVGVALKFHAIKKLTDLYWLSLIVYFSTYFLLHEFTQIRAGVASGFVLLSILYIHKRNAAKFFVCVSAASFFHYSALIVFPLYFLSNATISRTAMALMLLAVPAGMAMNYFSFNFIYTIPIELIRVKVQVYMMAEELRSIKLNPYNAVYIFKYLMLYVFLFCHRKLYDISPLSSVLIKFYAISLFSYLALSFNSAFAIRISELIGIVEIILVPILFYVYRNRLVAFLGVIFYSSASLALGLYETELIINI